MAQDYAVSRGAQIVVVSCAAPLGFHSQKKGEVTLAVFLRSDHAASAYCALAARAAAISSGP